MKRYAIQYLSGLLLIISFVSCQDTPFLNQAPYSFTSPQNFYRTENDFKMALAGCYEALNTSSISGGMWVPDGTYARGLYYILEGCSDNVVANNSAVSCDFEKGTFVPANVNLNYFWSAFFTGISRCNYLLDNIKTAHISDSLKTQISGETRFMRAFYYQHLAQCFGAVPLNTSSTPDNKAPRVPLSDVYSLIISDFDFAYKNLNGTGINKSSANKWTAGAYLGTLYNYLASCKRYNVGATLLAQCPLNSFDWVNADSMSTKAVTVLSDVVNNSPYKLLPQAQYSYLFREGTKSYQYQECLFLSEWSDVFSDAYSTNTELFTPQGSNTYAGSYGRHMPTYNLYKSYLAGDIRRDWNITGRYETGVVQEVIQNVSYFVPKAAIPATSLLQWCTGKFRLAVPGTYSAHGLNVSNSLNYPLMRLADVKLQLAEAFYFTHEEPSARAILTEIRQRVLDPAKTTIDDLNLGYHNTDFVQELLDERRRELCFESKRRIDLIRFDKTTSAIQNLPVEGNTYVQGAITTLQANWSYNKIWLPIPQTQLDLNSNLIQNAGY
jgi:starch-binding outer membrane protein, SusD/RagB family